jgi:RNA 2',3'-cyclic 3'-phosphodiesterase
VSGSAARPAARRLFFALWPETAERIAMAAATADAVAASGGRAVPEGQLHLTLAFLGAVPAARSAELQTLVRQVGAAWPPVMPVPPLSFTRVTLWRKAQVLVALAEVHAELAAVAEALREGALAAGLSPDLKPFRAHVTVARKVARALRSAPLTRVLWSCRQIALVESRSSSEGPLYSVVESAPLGKPGKLHQER